MTSSAPLNVPVERKLTYLRFILKITENLQDETVITAALWSVQLIENRDQVQVEMGELIKQTNIEIYFENGFPSPYDLSSWWNQPTNQANIHIFSSLSQSRIDLFLTSRLQLGAVFPVGT